MTHETRRIWPLKPLMETARWQKSQWFGHLTRKNGSLENTIMHGTVEGRRGAGRLRGESGHKKMDGGKVMVENDVT